MTSDKSNDVPVNNEVKNKEEAINKLVKDRNKIKQESESFARKVTANTNTKNRL
jgi:PII-like signaling protein